MHFWAHIENKGSTVRESGPLTSSETLDKSPNLSDTMFTHLLNGDLNSWLRALLSVLDELLYVKCWF